MEIFYEGHWRMDWGLGNPNKTAVLIAELMIASWVFAFWSSRPAADAERRTSNVDRRSLRPSWGFWLSVTLSVVLGGCLIMTYSRGGMVAALCGLVILLAFTPRPWARRRVIAILAAAVILGAFAFSVNATGRYSQGVGENDPSITNRLLIWKMAPRMMVDAPTGWGWGRSGDAYMQWYQPVDRLERYRSLVNSHFTWMVEMGWLGRGLYVMAWGLILMLCWPTGKRKLFFVPLALWIVLGVGAFFSSVGESKWMWILPGVAVLSVFFLRLREYLWPKFWIWATAMGAGVFIMGGFYVAGSMSQSPYVIQGAVDSATVRWALDPKTTLQSLWIVAPNQSILGEHYGHAIRSKLLNDQSGCVGVATKMLAVPLGEPLKIVLMGKYPDVSPFPQSTLVILNPLGLPPLTKHSSEIRVRILWGELREDGNRRAWDTWAKSNTSLSFENVAGAGLFMPNWLEYVVSDGDIKN